MDTFWLNDEARLAKVRAAQRGAAAAQPSESGSPFLTDIEQVLGEETEPDAEFFVDSWTMGVAEASENFLRRKKQQKSRVHDLPQWAAVSTFSFPPFFDSAAVASPETTQPLRKPSTAQHSMADSIVDWQSPGNDEWDNWREDEAESANPLTVESACRILGVTTASSREQIRAAYRKMATRYHPDRLAQAATRDQKLASDHMASINEAYRLLCAELVGQWTPCFS